MIAEAVYTILFYLIGAMAVALAVAVTVSRRLLRAAVYLVGVLLMSAGLYVMLGAEFLAGIQVLVYVGGVVVLVVFAVMLTHSTKLEMDHPPLHRRILAVLASVTFAAITIFILKTSPFVIASNTTSIPDGSAQAIGRKLLDTGSGGYVLPFEIISMLLLAVTIGGIVIARKTPVPGQPFTSGGDLPGEADFKKPKSQRIKLAEDGI